MNTCPNKVINTFGSANGLIRKHFSKKMPFINITDEHIVEVQNNLNSRLRKYLDIKHWQKYFSIQL